MLGGCGAGFGNGKVKSVLVRLFPVEKRRDFGHTTETPCADLFKAGGDVHALLPANQSE